MGSRTGHHDGREEGPPPPPPKEEEEDDEDEDDEDDDKKDEDDGKKKKSKKKKELPPDPITGTWAGALADDDEILAVVGPLLTAECEVAGRSADEAGVPLLALTRREGVALGRRMVLRLGSTPRLEAARMHSSS